MENKLIADLHLEMTRTDYGAEANGRVEFHGTDIDKAAVIAHIFDLLKIEPELRLMVALEALSILADQKEAAE